jgi:phage/plasmid-associated DNA primase
MSNIIPPEINDDTRDALRLAAGRTRRQVSETGSFCYKMKKPGENPEREFFDTFVYLLGEKGKAGKAFSIVSEKNFKISPEDLQLSYDDLSGLNKKAHEFIKFSKAIEEDDSPIPEEYRHLARLNEKGMVSLEYQAIADHLLSMFNIVSYVGGDDGDGIDAEGDGRPDLYVYDDRVGIYSKDTSSLKNEIERISKTVQFKGSVVNAAREIFFYVSYADPQRVYPFNKGKNLIPVKNGVICLNFGGGEHILHPHDPKNKFTYLIPVKYDPKAAPDPIDKILRDYVNPEDVWYLYQIIAQTVLQGFCDCTTYRTAYLIQGPARGGKSTFCDLLVEYFFSQKFVANETLQDLCGGSRFCTYNLPGKFLNLYDDLDDMGTLNSVSAFKNLIGSYNQSIEKKGVQRRTEKISCVHCFTCNRPPLLENKRIKTDSAWWDRWNYIRFKDSEFESDPAFQERNFTPENMSGFLNRVLSLVVDIKNDPKLFRKQGYETVISNWDVSSDPISAFVADCFYETTGRTEKYEKEGMLQAYKEYCKVQGVDDIHGIDTVTKLSKHLINEGFNSLGRGKNKEYLYQAARYWQGIAGVTNPTHKDDTSQKGIQ